MTELAKFRKLKAKDLHAYMKTPNLVEPRRIYNPAEFRELNCAAIELRPANLS